MCKVKGSTTLECACMPSMEANFCCVQCIKSCEGECGLFVSSVYVVECTGIGTNVAFGCANVGGESG